MEFSLEAMDTESLREQLQSIEQEYSTSYGSRVQLDLSNPHEQLKETIQELNQTQRTCACIAGIALFLMDKQDELMDKQISMESEMQNQQIEMNEYKEHIKMQEMKLAKKSEKKKQAIIEKHNLKITNEDLKKKLNENSQQLSQLREKYSNLKRQNKNFQTQSTESNEYQKAIKEKIQQYKYQIKQQEEMIQQKDITLKDLQISLSQEKIRSQEIEDELSNLQQEVTTVRHGYEKVKEDYQILSEKYEAKNKLLKSKIDEINELQKEKEMYDPHFESPNPQQNKPRKSSNLDSDHKTPVKTDLGKELFLQKESDQQIDNQQEVSVEEHMTLEVDEQTLLEESEKNFKGTSSGKQKAFINFTPVVNNQSPSINNQQIQPMKFVTNQELQRTKQDYISFVPQKQQQRDPIEQHFQLLTQSAKINSPYMDQICTVSNSNLYAKCQKQNVPIHKWHQWIEKELNNEYLNMLYIQALERKKTFKKNSKQEAKIIPQIQSIKELRKSIKH